VNIKKDLMKEGVYDEAPGVLPEGWKTPGKSSG
jgi:hypothetical protein